MPKIHPTAIISPEAQLADDVIVGPYAIIEGLVKIGPGCEIKGNACLMGPLTLGARNLIYPTAVLGGWPQDRKFKGEFSEVIIGDDNIFREGATVHRGSGLNSKTVIGHRNYLMVGAHVGHNGLIGNDITFVNGGTTGGYVQVGDKVIIGSNCAIHQFCRVGRLAMLSNSAGSSIDVPPFFISMSTNFITQLNAVGLRRSGMPRESIDALRAMFRFVYRTHARKPLRATLEILPPELMKVNEVQEFVTFCKESKRGISRFQAWSTREGIVSKDANE